LLNYTEKRKKQQLQLLNTIKSPKGISQCQVIN